MYLVNRRKRWFDSISLYYDYGEVAQLVRACDSYPQGRWFKSTLRYKGIAHSYIGYYPRFWSL